jgi:hypothetical protein
MFRHQTHARLAGTAVLALSLCAPARHARAQAPSDATDLPSDAVILDAEGTKDMDAGDFEAGCPKLARSYRLDPGIGVLLRLALCYEGARRTASAWTRYHEAAELARRGGNLHIEELARRRADALEPVLSKLTVRVKRVEGLQVSLDGEALANDAWDLPVPIDPGRHEVVAVAPGMRRFVAPVTIPPDGGARSLVDVALDEASPALAPAGEAAGTSGREGPLSSRKEATWQRPTALALGLLGAAGLITGGIFGVSALSSMNAARDLCPAHTGCKPDALALQDDARSAGRVSTGAFVAGTGAAIGGVVLWLVATHADEHRSAWHVGPLVDRRTAGLGCTASF